MPRIKTISGEFVTVTETKSTEGLQRHWNLVQGTAQGVLDFLNESKIPEHKVKSLSLSSSTWYAWYHL